MRMNIIDITDGWLVDWSQTGGPLKEWVRDMELTAINHGWFYALYIQPVYWYQNLCHVLSWAPIIWRDRDWDYVFLFIMMREKLRRMREHFEEEKITDDYEKVALEILIAENALDRLIKDDYVEKDWEEHRKKYGGFKLGSKSSIEDSADVRRIGQKEIDSRLADVRFLGDWMAKHIWKWWS